MYVKYNGVTRPLNECTVTRQMTAQKDALNNITGQQWRYSIGGTIIGTGADDAAIHANVTTQRRAIEAMFFQNNRDFQVLDNDNSTVIYELLAKDCVNGPSVTSYTNPDGGAGNYVSSLPYTVEIEGLIGINNSGTASKNLLTFSEQLTIIGNGGPKRVIRVTRNTLPIRQQTSLATMVRAVQSGNAKGAGPWPIPPNPIWPNDMVNDTEQGTRSYEDGKYLISWSYDFESIGPLAGVPNLP